MRSSKNCSIRLRGRRARIRGAPREVPETVVAMGSKAVHRWLQGWDGVGRGTFGTPLSERQFGPKECAKCGNAFTPTAPHNIYCPVCKGEK